MLSKTIKYTDFDGNEREETHYFNLMESEVTEMELGMGGGMSTYIKRIVEEKDNKKIMAIFKEIIAKSYGKKSDDGRKFMKSPEILADFEATEAYSVLFMELATDGEAAAKFVNGIMPKKKDAQKPELKTV